MPAASEKTAPVTRPARPGSARRSLSRGLVIGAAACLLLAAIVFLLWRFAPDFLPIGAAQQLAIWIILATLAVLLPCVLPVLSGRRKEWERVFELILSQRRYYRLMLLGSFILVASELTVPVMLKFVLDSVVNEYQDLRLLFIWLSVMFVLLLIRGVSGFIRTYNAQSLAYNISTDLRNRLYAHLQKLSYSFFDRSRQGELMSKVTNDVVVLQNFIMNSSEDFFVAPLKVVGAVAMVFLLNWQLALVVLATAVVTSLLLKLTGGRLRAINRDVQTQLGDLTARLAEGLNTIRLSQSFGIESQEVNKFTSSNNQALKTVTGHVRISAILLPLIEMLGFAAPLIIIAAMSVEAITATQHIRIGDLLAIGAYGALVANPLGKLSRLLVTLAMGEAASSRIFSILETKPAITDAPNAREIETTDGYIEFADVSLQYGPGEPQVLDGVNLDALPGEVVALVGESGSGKSSMVHLVPRFYDVTGGCVKLDGHDIRQLKLTSLRKQIGIVSQDTILIHGTVRENISYGTENAWEDDIVNAAISANAHNFILEFPNGYDTMVGERGVTLSGGQRQRIAIARVLLRDPRILLLDEATSALDSVSEAVVQDALNKLMYGRTTLLVAHRLSTVRRANKIVVFKRGKIIEQGTHEELLQVKDGEYARLVKLQGLEV